MATAQPANSKPGQATSKDAARPATFYQKDFPYIRRAAITLAACLAFSASLVGASVYLLKLQQNAKANAHTQNAQAREKYARAETDKHEITDAQPRYLQLVTRGFVGEERRLNWIERIKAIQKTRKLLPITYEIFPQQVFQIEDTTITGELELRGSRMVLTMDLLHELDLLNFLDELKAGEYYVPTECSIKPPQSNLLSALAPRLSAECTLYWITLGARAPSGDGSQPAAR